METVGCIKMKANKLQWMKLLCLLFHQAVIVASKTERLNTLAEFNLKKRSLLINILINKLFAYIRHIIKQGSDVIGIPVLDPFEMKYFNVIIPTELFNLNLRFNNISVIGFGGFVLHKNVLHLSNLTFEIEISLPRIIISAEAIDISQVDNNFTSTIAILNNKEKRQLEMDNFRLQANLLLKQSEDEKSVLIDKIEDTLFDIPSFKICTDGTVGSETEVFSDFEEGFVNNVTFFKDAFVQFISNAIPTFGNPILNRLNTWQYIGVLL